MTADTTNKADAPSSRELRIKTDDRQEHRATPTSRIGHSNSNGTTTSRSARRDANAALKRQVAIPTPLVSPGHSHDSSSTGSEDDILPDDEDTDVHHRTHLSIRQRLKHFTWTWFTMTMATGQLANVVAAIPYPIPHLHNLGQAITVLNILLFLLNTTCISLRFYLHRPTFWSSLTHPTESLFVPAFVISIGTILTNLSIYLPPPRAVPALEALFWTYCVLAVVATCGIYLIMWSTQTFTISRMTPVWIFPAYPLLVIAPHAAVLVPRVADHARAMAVITGGFMLQGVGFMVSFMVYAAFLYRLMTNKLPDESIRPGMFISVGPSGFTVAGVVGLGAQIGRVVPDGFMGVGELAAVVTAVMANWVGVWLWGLAVFFLIVSIGAHWTCVGSKRMPFAMTWFSFVFPNTGLTIGTFAVAKALDNEPMRILGCIFTVALFITWAFVFAMMIRAVYQKQILWPQRQEDRNEGGWKMPEDAKYEAKSSGTDEESGVVRSQERSDDDKGSVASGTKAAVRRATTALKRPLEDSNDR